VSRLVDCGGMRGNAIGDRGGLGAYTTNDHDGLE